MVDESALLALAHEMIAECVRDGAAADAAVAKFYSVATLATIPATAVAQAHSSLARELTSWREELDLEHSPSGELERKITELAATLGELLRARAAGTIAVSLEQISEDLRALARDRRRGGVAEDRRRRSREGGHHTPLALATALAAAALEASLSEPHSRWLDPACGGGSLLLAAGYAMERRGSGAAPDVPPSAGTGAESARVLSAGSVARLHGVDISKLCVFITRCVLTSAAAEPAVVAPILQLNIRHDDFLLPSESDDDNAQRPHNLLLNPPFLSRRQPKSALSAERDAALKARYGDSWSSTADLSLLFMERAHSYAGDRGVIGAILPSSWLSVQASAALRGQLEVERPLRWLWSDKKTVFRRAALTACAIVLAPARPGEAVELKRLRSLPPVEFQENLPQADALPRARSSVWSVAFVEGLSLPPLPPLPTGRLLGSAGVLTADFRQHFYGLKPFVFEGSPRAARRYPKLLLTGHIDPATSKWGSTKVRFLKSPFLHPLIDLPKLIGQGGELASWAENRLNPKIVVATQTRVLEAVVDCNREYINTTPTLTLTPADESEIWHLAAAILSPIASLWAWTYHHGSARSTSAIKLSARQLRELPLPRPSGHWDEAALHVQRAHAAVDLERRWGELGEAAAHMLRAYEVGAAQEASLTAWWSERNQHFR